MQPPRTFTLPLGHIGLLVHRANERPVATLHGGLFQLSFLAVNRMRPLKTEAYRLIWQGPAAQAWWTDRGEGAHFPPSTSLYVVAHELQSHISGRGSVIEAHIISCQIAPQRTAYKREQLSTQ